MTEPKPLEPLLHDETIGDELRAVLDARSAHDPSAAELSRLAAKLAAALPPGTLPPTAAPGQPPTAAPGQPPPAPPSGAASGALRASGAAKIVVGVALAGAIGAAIWLARDEAPVAPSTPPSALVASSAPPAPPPSAPASVEAPPVAVTAASTTPPRSTSTAPRPSAIANVAAPPEATLLKRAHEELLRGSPDQALATTAEHERAYPQGALAQEREVIAIEALVALGRRDDAARRAARFHQLHPGSSHADRIDRIVGRP